MQEHVNMHRHIIALVCGMDNMERKVVFLVTAFIHYGMGSPVHDRSSDVNGLLSCRVCSVSICPPGGLPRPSDPHRIYLGFHF